MALTPSKMLPLGTKAPFFSLPDSHGKMVMFNESSDAKAFVVMFICNHCPYVKHIADKLAEVTNSYIKKGVAVFAINSNDVIKYPDDAPEKMALEKKQRSYEFPYLFDESQTVAKNYDAACTPDFYLFDSRKILVYRGQFDDSRPGNGKPVTGDDLTFAVDCVLSGKHIPPEQRPSIGCNIKWKS